MIKYINRECYMPSKKELYDKWISNKSLKKMQKGGISSTKGAPKPISKPLPLPDVDYCAEERSLLTEVC